MAKTFNELKNIANEIRTEIRPLHNSAGKVGGELVDIVEKIEEGFNEINKKANATNLATETKERKDADANIIKKAPWFNVTDQYPLAMGSYYAPAEARALIPAEIRKSGLIITYSTSSGVWVKEQFLRSSASDWTNEANWMDISSDTPVYNVSAINNKFDYTPAAAREAVPAEVRKRGLKITYATSTLVWTTEQFIGSAVSGWGTASNWIKEGIVDIYNVSSDTNNYNFANLAAAVAAVPSQYRKRGLVLIYASNNNFYLKQFWGSNLANWENLDNWKEVDTKGLSDLGEVVLYGIGGALDDATTNGAYTYTRESGSIKGVLFVSVTPNIPGSIIPTCTQTRIEGSISYRRIGEYSLIQRTWTWGGWSQVPEIIDLGTNPNLNTITEYGTYHYTATQGPAPTTNTYKNTLLVQTVEGISFGINVEHVRFTTNGIEHRKGNGKRVGEEWEWEWEPWVKMATMNDIASGVYTVAAQSGSIVINTAQNANKETIVVNVPNGYPYADLSILAESSNLVTGRKYNLIINNLSSVNPAVSVKVNSKSFGSVTGNSVFAGSFIVYASSAMAVIPGVQTN